MAEVDNAVAIKEYQNLVKSINRKLAALESRGLEFVPAYQEVKHASQRVQELRTKKRGKRGGKLRLSMSSKAYDSKNMRMLRGMNARLSMSRINKEIEFYQREHKIETREQAIKELRANSIFDKLVENLSAFYDSKQVSEVIHELDERNAKWSYEEMLHEIIEENGQDFYNHDPSEASRLFSLYYNEASGMIDTDSRVEKFIEDYGQDVEDWMKVAVYFDIITGDF